MPGQKAPSLQSRHNEALVQLENYKLLVESVEDYAIFLLDSGGHIISWNKGAQKTKGYRKSEILGKHFSDFYTPEDKQARKPERELEIAKQFGRVEDEDWRVRKDGSRFWANVVITALWDKAGKLVGFAKVTRDLTERKQHEDDLRKANNLLRQQQYELTKLNESKDEFISLASHQLRTPATAIKQLLGIILQNFHVDLDHTLPIIQKAYDANDRQISIVNSLLQVAQLDAGKINLNKTVIDVKELLKDVIDEQSDTYSSRSQTLKFSCVKKPVRIVGDARYLRMAFENIIDNASKYTRDKGKIAVSISKDDQHVCVSVSDTGVGIPKESIPELFVKFKRIPNELTQKVSGSGLGLYWVREVITLHGGNVDVASEPRVGTTFVVSLPGAAASA